MNNSLRTLGCYSGSGGHGRFPSSQLLTLNKKLYLIDCGEGTQFLLKKYKIRLNSIDNIFISHLHGDHYFGLPGLISYFNLKGREKDLNIYGPKGLKDIINLIMKSGKSWTRYKLNFFELKHENKVILNNETLSVESFKLSHRIPTTGFVFKLKNDTSNLSFAYCSDTKFFPEILDFIKNVNLIYHESTFLEKHIHLAIKTKHSTALQAATIAKKANANKLILGHFSARYNDLNLFKLEAVDIFQNVYLAKEGELYSF